MKRQLLAEMGLVLPELVNGRVCVVDEENYTYQTIAIGRYTYLDPNDWKPEDFSVITTPKYRCVVIAKQSDKERYLVNSLYRKLYGQDSPYLVEENEPIQRFSL